MIAYTQLGHNMWKCTSESNEGEWYYLSKHLCPFLDYPEDESKEEALVDFEDYHYICSCPSFSIQIPGPKNENPLEVPCKHVYGLWEYLER